MAREDDSHSPDSGTPTPTGDTAPIVVQSQVHGVSDWHPASPAEYGETAHAKEAAAARLRVVNASVGGQSPAPPELDAGESKRAFSLDALRGLFLISMTMGFTISSTHLPVWMYHRQFPFDAEKAVDVAGISWRDLAYASFLFTMAAALPLTLSRRIDKGELEIGIIKAAFKRYALLLVYALLIGHSNTFILGYTQSARVLSVIGFVIMAMIFTRRRSDWNESRFRVINLTGWVLAIAFLAITPISYGQTFSFHRIDDIIAGLAFASLFGSLIWYFTRDNLLPRLAILAMAVAMYLGAKGDGWLSQFWWDWKFDWAFSAQRFVLFCVIIPGTIVGDVILRWMRSPGEPEVTPDAWGRGRIGALTLLCVAFTPVVTVGLFNRNLQMTTALVAVMLIGGGFLTWGPVRPVERMLRSLYLWAGVWMLIGLFLEPFEGGIHKVPDTLTYFFTITGTTSMLLVALTALIDALGRRKWVAVLIDVGHNPLLLYVLFTILINSLIQLVPALRDFMMGSVPLEMTRYLVEVLMIVTIVRFMSRKRIYWRT